MKRKIKTTKRKATSTFYCYFCSRHILITFVGMTLLIVNYGVNTVQMSAVPHRNENCNSSYNSYTALHNTTAATTTTRSISICGSGNNIVSSINGNNLNNNNSNSKKNKNININYIYRRIIWKRSVENLNNINSNRNTNFLHNVTLPTPTSTVYKDNKVRDDDFNDNYANNRTTNNSSSNINNSNFHNLKLESNINIINHTGSYYKDKVVDEEQVEGQFVNLRKSRLFGLLGTNFSLSYNLSLNSGSSSAGNITVVAPNLAPAPAYYYAPAPYYGYDYYNPYGYYNPYAYNPYGYNPYAGYGYY